MSIDVFMEHFPEWELCLALEVACQAKRGKLQELLKARLFVGGSEGPKESTLEQLFSPSPSLSGIDHQRGLIWRDAERWGFEKEHFDQTYWTLRPDFIIDDLASQTLVLLEAKGGSLPNNYWKQERLKESKYDDFLKEAKTLKSKGLFFIIPQKFQSECSTFMNRLASSLDGIMRGWFLWEDLMPVINDELMRAVVDELIKETKGLKILRDWEANKRT